MKDDKTLENLLDLDGIKMVIDEKLGLWLKFEVSITSLSVRYEWGTLFIKPP